MPQNQDSRSEKKKVKLGFRNSDLFDQSPTKDIREEAAEEGEGPQNFPEMENCCMNSSFPSPIPGKCKEM